MADQNAGARNDMNRAVPVRPERYNFMWIFDLGDEIPYIPDTHPKPGGIDHIVPHPTLVQNPQRSGKESGGRITFAWIENGDPSLGTPHDLAPRNIGALSPEPAALSNDLEDRRRRAVPRR